jgi:hypothetical protein
VDVATTWQLNPERPPAGAGFRTSVRGYDPAAVDRCRAALTIRLQGCRRRVDELEAELRRLQIDAPAARVPSPAALAVAAEASAILQAAEQDRQLRLGQAEAAASADRARAQQEVAAALAQADSQAQDVTAAAWQIHHRIVAESRELAEQIRGRSAALADRISAAAEEIPRNTRIQATQLAVRTIGPEASPPSPSVPRTGPAPTAGPGQAPRAAAGAPIGRPARLSL